MTHTPRVDAITAVGCGCLATLSDGMILLEYCPMHEAAKDMLAALKACTEYIKRTIIDPYETDEAVLFVECYQNSVVAIKRAEGRE